MARRKPRIGDEVRVKWHDARSWQGWFRRGKVQVELAEAETIGFLIARDKNGISISGTIAEGRRCSDSLDIPLGCIHSIIVTRRPKRQKEEG